MYNEESFLPLHLCECPHLVLASFGRNSVASKMKPRTTFFQTLLNAVNAISGYGLLAMPYAVAQGGWLSLGPLLLIAAIWIYMALLLQRCMDSNPMVESYAYIVQLAFGSRGRILAALLANSELYLVVIGLLLFGGENLAGLFPK
ncbi:hypothetical protein HPP92_004698 [Vanilla planifolia]|uniref:Amino acid transporter transmembrane domain-containing protein n=1 Tax=Vanilla planifolia TaxID=51239 RepID=A0A835RG39_VANPL|nr:hypothetical protein HPP92_005043 [Vanilla planifolia]KAG0493704.1 hypothetical protein HPP92_004698 [Vanilla planifolia]